jgi:hypothetical protein
VKDGGLLALTLLPDKTLKFTEQLELGNSEKLVSQSGKEPKILAI